MFPALFPQPPKPRPPLPMLFDALNTKKRHYLTALYPGDQLHVTAKGLGFPKGAKLPVYGFGALYDEQGQLYAIRAYVRPLSTNQPGVVPADQRRAVRCAFEGQFEQWFGYHLLYVLELDLLDHADCLRLERLSERVSRLLPADTITYRQAA